MEPFLEALSRRVLVCDGAMGTMLYTRGIFINRSFEALNLVQPELVLDVHRQYVRAGADVIETNTFGANRIKLAMFGLDDSRHAMNAAGARLARQAARDRVYVAGAIGPLGIRVEPWGKTGVDEAEAFFREQARALAEGGVDLFVLETFRDLNEIGAAIAAIRGVSDKAIVAQMTTEEDGNSLDGTPPEKFAPELVRRGADVVGVNCSVGPAPMLETLERIERSVEATLSAQPNAGRPRDIEGRTIYLSSPEYLASYARRYIRLGVRLVGGCCGTTPEHIRQIKNVVQSLARSEMGSDRAPVVAPVAAQAPSAPPVSRSEKSRLARALAEGRFVTAVELQPPRGFDAGAAIETARAFAARGVDAVSVPEGSRGGARMSAVALAVLVQQHAGVEPLLHYACRDRYLLGMQSELLGAHAMGLRNVVVFTGDPRKVGDYSDATVVIDVDSIGLTNALARLNHGCDVGGQAIGPPAAFHVGVIANPTAPNLDDELRRFEYKVEAGAEFAMTPPLYDVGALERFIARTSDAHLPLIVQVRPFDSLRHAEYLANEVPNLRVPDPLLERMRHAGVENDGATEGAAIALEIGRAVRGMAQGIQIAGPEAAILTVLEGLGAPRG
jgi:methionine synthase I (cobalamin-dependent)/5,10-methylenetetrahydrofolate reductase